ncbi:Substrate-specific component NikM of nickel ECF transporter [Olavius algarvensis associated proteobacterium Delta 3]|nr:Substrate-specific component NikM of nickel ECF transporter [Olavius algarvensis associated proteobacterium Delta 3]CAB5157891.1 Substrate-specific component NikM of nickel ECF transporter [Olavius algarvensis associated proteobacterium Delta 3]
MHISEGILSGPVLLSGAALAVVGTGIGLKQMDYDRVAQAGVLSASFFVASLIHVPIGPSSIHLILNGVVGLLLGWGAFPAILVALVLQAILFQYGGITTLGVNTVLMALPAVLCYYLFIPMIRSDKKGVFLTGAFFVGSGAILLSGIIVALSLVFTGESFLEAAALVVAAHVPIMVIEGVITMFCVGFIKKVQPGLLLGAAR